MNCTGLLWPWMSCWLKLPLIAVASGTLAALSAWRQFRLRCGTWRFWGRH
jgi:hypothetical protein